jgi:hypothetical protein
MRAQPKGSKIVDAFPITNRQVCRYIVLLMVCLTAASCARYKPKAYIPPGTIRNQYLADVTASTLLQTYNAMPAPTPTPDTNDAAAQRQAKVARRNQILTELIALVDQNYSVFEDRYYGSDAAVNFGGDVVNLGLTGVSSVTGTAHLKSVLSAIATGTTGMKTSYQKNFFDQQTRSAVVQKMRAGRATQLATIQDPDHMKAPVVCPDKGCVEKVPKSGDTPEHIVAPYSLETGLSDVEKYYEAGTVIGALQAIAESAGQDQTKAKAQQQTNSAMRAIF